MNKNRVTPTIVGDDSASKRKVFFANFDNAGHQGGNATNFARTETGAGSFDATKKQKRKLLKIIGASSLAFFMGIGTLCGVLIAPMNSTHASTSGGNMPTNSADLYNKGIITKDDLNQETPSGEAVVLDPESDETIFTTESGFEIKSHNVAGQTLANSKVQYFTLGSYNGTSLNWIILATSTTLAENTTDAGIAINAANANGLVSMMADSKLSANQALVISEKVIPISSYTFNVTPKSGTTTGSLPPASSNASGWQYEGNLTADSNTEYYYKLLIDSITDYYTSYTTYSSHSNTINGWFTGSSLALSSYCGNKIVKNSNFNGSCYGFALTNNQLTTYLPTSLCAAKDTAGTSRNYWCGDNITYSIDTSNYEYSYDYNDHVYKCFGTGSGVCSWTGRYVNTSGALSEIIRTTGTLSHTSNYTHVASTSRNSYNIYIPRATFTSSGTTSLTAYYRPAMVVDLSKF